MFPNNIIKQEIAKYGPKGSILLSFFSKLNIDNGSAMNAAKNIETIDISKPIHNPIKNNSAGSASWWWLRSANSFSSKYFYIVGNGGGWGATNADRTNGVSPAFRIG